LSVAWECVSSLKRKFPSICNLQKRHLSLLLPWINHVLQNQSQIVHSSRHLRMSRSSLPAPALETVGGASNASIVGDKSMQTAACCRGTHMHPFCVRTTVSHAVAGPPPNPCVPPLAFIVSAHGTPHGERQSSSEKH